MSLAVSFDAHSRPDPLVVMSLLFAHDTVAMTEQAFYRSFSTTLFMNIPYGCVMVAANESLKSAMRPSGNYDTQTFLLAGSGAGAIAAVATNPLDVVKTRLQTQAIQASADEAASTTIANGEGAWGRVGGATHLARKWRWTVGAATVSGQHTSHGGPAWWGQLSVGSKGTAIHSRAARCPSGRCMLEKPTVTLQYQGLLDAVSAFERHTIRIEISPQSLFWRHVQQSAHDCPAEA